MGSSSGFRSRNQARNPFLPNGIIGRTLLCRKIRLTGIRFGSLSRYFQSSGNIASFFMLCSVLLATPAKRTRTRSGALYALARSIRPGDEDQIRPDVPQPSNANYLLRISCLALKINPQLKEPVLDGSFGAVRGNSLLMRSLTVIARLKLHHMILRRFEPLESGFKACYDFTIELAGSVVVVQTCQLFPICAVLWQKLDRQL